MKLTIDSDDDVYRAAMRIAGKYGQSIEAVITDLARHSAHSVDYRLKRNGVPIFPLRKGGMPVAPEFVNSLRDEVP